MASHPESAATTAGTAKPTALMRYGVIGLLSILLLAALGYTWARNSRLPAGNGAPAEVSSDRDYRLVSKHLTESLGNDDWRFVRWWPARKMEELHRRNLEQMQIDIDDLEDRAAKTSDEFKVPRDLMRAQAHNIKRDLEKTRERGPVSVCRIQYRTDSNRVHDRLFIVDREDVTPLSEGAEELARPEFPESETQSAPPAGSRSG